MPTKRPIFLYSLLAVLFAITLLYQVRYCRILSVVNHGTSLSFLSTREATDRLRHP